MKRDLAIHFTFMLAFFILISLLRGWVALEFLPFWFGGIIGVLLPDIDHFIYVYLLKPNAETSQKAAALISERKFIKSWDYLASSRLERTNLVFHTAFFQLIFVIFAFLIISSTGSMLGRGLVLAFLLHLLIDQYTDMTEGGSLDIWFKDFPFKLEQRQKRYYLIANLLVLLLFAFI